MEISSDQVLYQEAERLEDIVQRILTLNVERKVVGLEYLDTSKKYYKLNMEFERRHKRVDKYWWSAMLMLPIPFMLFEMIMLTIILVRLHKIGDRMVILSRKLDELPPNF